MSHTRVRKHLEYSPFRWCRNSAYGLLVSILKMLEEGTNERREFEVYEVDEDHLNHQKNINSCLNYFIKYTING